MKQEEDNSTTNFASDTWLRESVKMETEDVKPQMMMTFDANVAAAKDYCKLKKEDTEDFGSDAWLRNSYEMDDVKENKAAVQAVIRAEKHDQNIATNKNKTKDGEGREKINSMYLKVAPSGSLLLKEEVIVSEMASAGMCTFKCSECPVTGKCWSYLAKHMKEKHKTNVTMSEVKKFATKVVVHVCKICSETVPCDNNFLVNHFRLKHKLKPKDYREMYHIEDIREVQFRDMLQNGKSSPTRIGNFCSFRCPQCNKLFRNLQALQRHFTLTKCQLYREILLHKYLEDVVTHNCKICSKLLLCDALSIKKHVINHDIKGIKEYAENTGCYFICKSDKETVFDENAKKAKVSQKIGNLCTYKCDKCNSVTGSWIRMRKHLNTAGHLGTLKIWKIWCIYIDKIVMHKCLICKEKVVNDKFFIQSHLQRKHQKTLLHYVKTHKLTMV